MKSIFVAAASLISFAVAAPHHGGGGHYSGCVSQDYAEKLVAEYAAVISGQSSDLGGPVKTARAIAYSDYEEQSDSANILGGLPLGQPTVSGKKNWIQESQSNPPIFTETQEIITGGCNKITWRWISTNFGSGEYPLQGIHVFTLTSEGQITRVNFELNSLAAALDTGYTVTDPDGNPV